MGHSGMAAAVKIEHHLIHSTSDKLSNFGYKTKASAVEWPADSQESNF